MPIEIRVPRLGWSMEEGTFSGWLKKEGEAVQAGDRLFSLESDKAVQEIEALDAGILQIPPSSPRSGDTVRVGQLLGYLVSEGEGAAPPHASGETDESSVPGSLDSSVGARARVTPIVAGSNFSVDTIDRDDCPISPRARRLAEELGVDWTIVRGTGRGGRIREEDIRAAAANR